jgi:hypothetical protein
MYRHISRRCSDDMTLSSDPVTYSESTYKINYNRTELVQPSSLSASVVFLDSTDESMQTSKDILYDYEISSG